MDSNQPLVSVVIPEMNEEECLAKLHAELCRVCDALPFRFEFLFVDDGSSDGSGEVLAELHRQDPRVRYLLLSRNFGQQAALSAGIAHATGDAVVMMDSDLQHPPSLIPQLLERWQEGFDVVNTIRLETEGISWTKNLFSRLFYPFFNAVTSVKIESGGADFRLLSRAVVDELNVMPERHRFLKGLVSWLGFRQSKIPYTAPRRWAGQAKMNFRKNLRFALDGLVSFSFFPLRLLMILGAGGMVGSSVYGFFALLTYLLMGTAAPGWISFLAGMTFLTGLQLAVMGMLGEYVSRILDQVRARPMYVVRESVGLPRLVRFPADEPDPLEPIHEKRLTG
jgi:dolichol-phosphate mannosyltransferase